MTSPFKVGSAGIPIYLIAVEYYTQWLSTQAQPVQTWLNSTAYHGEGLRLIADSEGALSQVVFGVTDTRDHFAGADLPAQLPPGHYHLDSNSSDTKALMRFAFAWGMGSYRFMRYKTDLDQQTINEFPCLLLPTTEQVAEAERELSATTLVRDLINTPASDMMPHDLGATVETLAQTFNAELNQIIGDNLLTENYPAVHVVGRASIHPPRFIDLRWGEENHPKVTLVGKGVCFDSGGLDMKGASGMRNMKKDMGGAAHAIGLAQLIMAHQLPVRLRLLIPAVENAVASNAYRPGDVITTRKGLTVEIDNTDAEGRLVLCDALAEADSEQPELLIDFATLTGAARVALGTELPGFFSSAPIVAQGLLTAGEESGDPVWQLPLHSPYKYLLKSEVADLVNCPVTPQGGAIVAALYLQAFVSDTTAWCHFDIMAWNTRALPGRPVGGEAMGLRATFTYLQSRYSLQEDNL